MLARCPRLHSRHPTVVSNGAGRRLFFPLRSCEAVGLRREKSFCSLFASIDRLPSRFITPGQNSPRGVHAAEAKTWPAALPNPNPRTWSDSAVEKYARLLEIPMKQRFEKLSNGNQTKVWLLLALSQGADLLILDEPTTALDPVSVDQLLHVLAEGGLDRGCTIFFSSHQLEEVERIAEYAGVIDRGKLLMESRLDDIKSEFRLITAAGNSLPAQTSTQVLSVAAEGNFYRYVVTKDADSFAAELSQTGQSSRISPR